MSGKDNVWAQTYIRILAHTCLYILEIIYVSTNTIRYFARVRACDAASCTCIWLVPVWRGDVQRTISTTGCLCACNISPFQISRGVVVLYVCATCFAADVFDVSKSLFYPRVVYVVYDIMNKSYNRIMRVVYRTHKTTTGDYSPNEQ